MKDLRPKKVDEALGDKAVGEDKESPLDVVVAEGQLRDKELERPAEL